MALLLACATSSFLPECNVSLVKDAIHVPFSLDKGSVGCYAAVSITVIVTIT